MKEQKSGIGDQILSSPSLSLPEVYGTIGVALTTKPVEDRRSGMSLTLVARKHSISRASVCRLMKEANRVVIEAGMTTAEILGHEVQL